MFSLTVLKIDQTEIMFFLLDFAFAFDFDFNNWNYSLRLILDEATSALDAESEHQITEALDKFMQGRTTVVIAHRLSTVKKATIVAVVAKGKIAEQGSHQELLSSGGMYRKLVQRQLLAKDADEAEFESMLNGTPQHLKTSKEIDSLIQENKQTDQAQNTSDNGSEQTLNWIQAKELDFAFDVVLFPHRFVFALLLFYSRGDAQ